MDLLSQLSKINKAGDTVTAGTDLGKYYNGKMGNSSDPHIHHGQYKVDDSKRDDQFTNVNNFVRQFDGTEYFYNRMTIPNDKKNKRWNL